MEKIKFGDTPLNTSAEVYSLVDTGTTLILMNSTIFRSLLHVISNATVHKGLIAFPLASQAVLQPLRFKIKDNRELTLQPEQYTLRADEARARGGNTSLVYMWVGEYSGFIDGFGVILGHKFLKHYYSVYDGENVRVGFAPAKMNRMTSGPVPDSNLHPLPDEVEVGVPYPGKDSPCRLNFGCCDKDGKLDSDRCAVFGCD